jgi:hypothetical protein
MSKAVAADNLLNIIRQSIDEWDPRFSPRKPAPERERLSLLDVGKEVTNPNPAPIVKLSDFEGRDFITTMSDRTDAGSRIVDINGVPLDRPVTQWGGQDYMFNNPGKVWASDETPVNDIMAQAKILAENADGQNPLFIPWRMTPTGGDYSTSTGEVILAYAHANMNKAQKEAFDKAMREFKTVGSMKDGKKVNAGRSIDSWPGIDDPSAPEVWRNTPDVVRKEIMDKVMDKQFRNNGGLSIAEARLANVDPRQANARDSGIQNIGEVYADQPVVKNNDHPSYNTAVPGQGIGTVDQDIGIFELLPEIVDARGIPDPLNPRVSPARDTRSLEMGAKTGKIEPEILEALQKRGVDVGNIDPKLLATMGLASTAAVGGSLLMPSDAEAATPSMGWREWPTQDQPIPTSPEERGFRPWSDYEPEPTYWDRVTSPETYADALAPYARGINSLIQTPVGQYIGDRVSDVMEDYDSVGGGVRGLGRGAYGLLSGESPSQALDAGIRVSNQTPAESGEAVRKWASDKGLHEDDAEALGFFTEWLTNPLDYAGMGLFGKTVKGAM